MLSPVNIASFKAILKEKKKVAIEEAFFTSESFFRPANLLNLLPFWFDELLIVHPHKQKKKMEWLAGVKIEQFLNSFTSTVFQGEHLTSYYPQPKQINLVLFGMADMLMNSVGTFLFTWIMQLKWQKCHGLMLTSSS